MNACNRFWLVCSAISLFFIQFFKKDCIIYETGFVNNVAVADKKQS
jgi:hypothetical protein